MPLLEEVALFIVWFDPDLPVLHIHLNNTGPLLGLPHVATVPGSMLTFVCNREDLVDDFQESESTSILERLVGDNIFKKTL